MSILLLNNEGVVWAIKSQGHSLNSIIEKQIIYTILNNIHMPYPLFQIVIWWCTGKKLLKALPSCLPWMYASKVTSDSGSEANRTQGIDPVDKLAPEYSLGPSFLGSAIRGKCVGSEGHREVETLAKKK